MATAEKRLHIPAFTPNQLNKSINMKSASERYSLLNSMSFQHPIASDISMVTIDYHSLITDGGFIVTRDGDKIEGYAEMTSAATGKKLRIYGTCTYDQQDAERTRLHQPQRPENSARKRLLPTARRGNDFRNPSLAGQPRHGSADRPGG